VRERLLTAFARQEDSYAGVDLANATRFGGALWFLGAFLSALLLPFVDGDDVIGAGGLLLGVALTVGAVAAGWRMRSVGARVNVNELFFYSYCAVTAIAAMVWITGGVGSPYEQLFILGVVYTCAVHPPRRAVPYLAVVALLAALPLVYDDNVTSREVLNVVTELVVWLVLALTVLVLMSYVRAQRLGLRREGEKARRQARLDPLTGLLNRRAFDEDLGRAIDRARASGQPLSVLVGDLDDFKDFNDRFGHLEGDRVLQAVAASLRAALRRPDVAYRWGGDEFAVILPEADARGGELVAARLVEAVARTAGPNGEPLGMSAGVAELDGVTMGGAAALVGAADRALMHAKGSSSFEVPQTRG
jgi:diguanylate cyclase (GGDEF)-like protein